MQGNKIRWYLLGALTIVAVGIAYPTFFLFAIGVWLLVAAAILMDGESGPWLICRVVLGLIGLFVLFLPALKVFFP